MSNLDVIKNWLSESGVSANTLAKGAGYTAAAVSQYLSGKYTGDNEAVENALLGAIEAQKDKIQDAPIVEIDTVRRINSIANVCRANGKLAVICGRAGTGKTKASKNYAEKNRGTIYVCADLSCTAKDLFIELVKTLGIRPEYSLRANFLTCRDRLTGTKRLIIIDEAEHLQYKALDLLRSLFDATGCGLMLVGTEILIHNLRGKRGEYEQLYSRVAIYQKTVPLEIEDVESFVSAIIPKSKHLANVFFKSCGGNMRILSLLVWDSIRISEVNGTAISADTVRAAVEDLAV
jgi:DNA transposition AAA+ family ATPase